MDIAEILRLADTITTVGLLVVILIAFARGVFVFPREVSAMKEQRDQWRDVAMRAMNLGERTVQAIGNGRDKT